jgi:glycosyltransferase involved in cell wall biosynthesis
VVSTNIGGVPDLLTEGETGLLVPRDDDRMMADAVLRLLQEPGLAARLSVNGRRLAESSSWDTVKTVWEKLITELGEHSRDPGRKRS